MKPILFSTSMVKSILGGNKTMTRRAIKPQPDDSGLWNDDKYPRSLDSDLTGWNGTVDETGESKEFKCRYGKKGTILWVRETFAVHEGSVQGSYAYSEGESVKYPPHYLDKRGIKRCIDFKADYPKATLKWKPSIFMPREACRLFLEVTDIRVERLQDISEQDAIAEGIGSGFQMNAGFPDYQHIENGVCTLTQDTAVMSYASLWDSINGKKYSWLSNPWVWCISFKKIEKPIN